MSLNSPPAAVRTHIAFFGIRNAGKSSLINAVTAQNAAIVSDIKGTTTDPVYKSMELLPLGPVVFIDTPGIDDDGELGKIRVSRAKKVLNKTDAAVLVADSQIGLTDFDRELTALFVEKNIPYIIAYNKADVCRVEIDGDNGIRVSAKTGEGITPLKERLAALLAGGDKPYTRLVGDKLRPYDAVVLVTPIDSAAPKGRMILPQQQVLRDCLDSGAITAVVRESELEAALGALRAKPRLVITDSQAFEYVSKITPKEIPLTSFSILFARQKGVLRQAIAGAKALGDIKDGDKILISEGCTHHRQCDDIGTVKMPRWIKAYTGAEPVFEFTSGGGFAEELSAYKLAVHCGGCMLNDREVLSRAGFCEKAGTPFTNYGVLIAYMNGILDRVTEVFADD